MAMIPMEYGGGYKKITKTPSQAGIVTNTDISPTEQITSCYAIATSASGVTSSVICLAYMPNAQSDWNFKIIKASDLSGFSTAVDIYYKTD